MMRKILTAIICLLPTGLFAQFAISGRILNQVDTKPVANASVFLNGATIGAISDAAGNFKLINVKQGKYDLVISVLGFETSHQVVMITDNNVNLKDIILFPRSIALTEVKINATLDQDWKKKYEIFKKGFLGVSALANDCTILNPEVLRLKYNKGKDTLLATSNDFLEIENSALGYKLKYMLAKFSMQIKEEDILASDVAGNIKFIRGTSFYSAKQEEISNFIHYEGSVLFEQLAGTPEQLNNWKLKRQEAYSGSQMHFLRAILSNSLEKEGFRVLQIAVRANPRRPRKTVETLMNYPLNRDDLVKATDKAGLYAIGCDGDALYISYNEHYRFAKRQNLNDIDNPVNTQNSIVRFNGPNAFFDSNGGEIINPNSLKISGAWGRSRVAELLPVDYEPVKNATSKTDQPDLISKVQEYSGQHFVEKAYLHFDKPYYAAGDTIFFKAYLTMGERHLPSTISSVLYVDFINTNNKISQSIILQINNGAATGDFALPDTLKTGNYQVRAYTKWMHNNGEESFFYQTIPVSSLNNNISAIAPPAAKTKNAAADIQFFPEGGSLVTGLKSKIAFKAINKSGLGVDVKGVITDNDNNEVTRFSSSHLGMGSFQLTPQAGKNYIAKLTFPDGTASNVVLPEVNKKGITLSINNDSLPKASVRIEANEAYYQENKNKEFTLLIYSGAVATAVSCILDSTLITLDIIKRRLHTGIARVTLFSPTHEPLCERILFVQNYDQLKFNLKSDKEVYSKREKVNINVHVLNRAQQPSLGNFSVSVVDEDKVPFEESTENTILTNMLLTSDLKGYVEQPNYYFNNSTDKTNNDLDLVMLTHGYRRFDWKRLINDGYPPVDFQPDSNLEITGLAESLSGKPLASATVSLIEMHRGQFYSNVTTKTGNFKFNNLVFSDTAKFLLQAVNNKGRNTTKLIYNKETGDTIVRRLPLVQEDTINQVMKPYIENKKREHDDDVKYGTLKGKLLRTVVIKAKKVVEESPNHNWVSKAFADQVIEEDQLAPGGTFADRIQGALHGAYIQRNGIAAKAYLGSGHGKPMAVILDGVVTDGDLNEITGLEIKDVEVLKFVAASTYGPLGDSGVLLVNTKRAEDRKVESIGVLPISPKGFYKAREFYSPKYTPDNMTNSRADLRSTIYWKPDLITDANGDVSFGFFNADGSGNYKITIEGMDENGNIGQAVYRYKVE